jgi:PTS system mannose-specific IID component
MISKKSFLKVFIGSFFIQAAWSFEKMQTLGFAAAISPAIKDVFKEDGQSGNLAIRRHMSFYNAHPYMASPVLGAAIKLEEAGMRGECPVDNALRFRSRVMAPLSAIGDLFFWGALRPLASCAGILAALIWGLWGPVVFLAVYNVVHISARWFGLKKGYALGEAVTGFVTSLALPRWGARARLACAFMLGFFLVGGMRFALNMADVRALGPSAIAFAVALVLVAVFSLLLKRGWKVAGLVYLVTIPLIIIGVLFF